MLKIRDPVHLGGSVYSTSLYFLSSFSVKLTFFLKSQLIKKQMRTKNPTYLSSLRNGRLPIALFFLWSILLPDSLLKESFASSENCPIDPAIVASHAAGDVWWQRHPTASFLLGSQTSICLWLSKSSSFTPGMCPQRPPLGCRCPQTPGGRSKVRTGGCY